MKYKKKPIMFYLYVLITHILLLLSFFYASSFLGTLEFELPDLRFVSIVRDVYRFMSYVQIPIIVICFVRAIGFDVKKFDFKKDLLDLGIDEEDNEEYEFELKLDSEDIKAQTKKRIRKFKYFYKENKFLFVILGIAIIVISISLIVNSILSIEKIYKQGDLIELGNFNVRILDVYKTNVDASGVKVNTKYYYLITKLRIENTSGYNSTFNKGIMRLSYSDVGSTVPTTEMNSKFPEFGVTYFSQIINAGETRDFVFIYEIPIEYYNNHLMLKYLMNVTYSDGKMNYEYKKVDLNPKEIPTETVRKVTKKLGEELVFEDSVLGDTKIVINNIKLADTLFYDTVKCSNGVCNTKNNTISAVKNSNFDLTLMQVDYNISYDYDMLGENYNNKKFISTFGSIRFEINGKEYHNRRALDDVTPFYTNNYSFLQVRDKLKSADKIYLDFTIRDKVYTYVLFDKNEEKEGA